MVASSKGGVGKSTVALGIAAALSERGRRVLICDLDFGNACLDMLLGVQDSVICTVQDAAKGLSSPEKALIKIDMPERVKRKSRKKAKDPLGELWFLPCAFGVETSFSEEEEDGKVTAASVCASVREAAEAVEAEYVILDTGAGANAVISAVAGICTSAIVVTGQMPVALRSAEKTSARLSELLVSDIRLMINNFDAKGITEDRRTGLFSAIDGARTPLLGVIPHDPALMLVHERLRKAAGEASVAFANIAARLEGENVPLFSGMKKLRKMKNKMYL